MARQKKYTNGKPIVAHSLILKFQNVDALAATNVPNELRNRSLLELMEYIN